MELQFGADAHFLIDFFHLMEHLASAATCIQPDDVPGWLKKQKKLILENQIEKVFQCLQKHISIKGDGHNECPAQKCFNYMDKRRKYFNYKEALDAELPIGSGEIESGIRNIIQSRLKIPGAWWRIENADAMLALKTVRVNGFWEQYWNQQRS